MAAGWVSLPRLASTYVQLPIGTRLLHFSLRCILRTTREE